jgi:small-conductance mechanosensitive channel
MKNCLKRCAEGESEDAIPHCAEAIRMNATGWFGFNLFGGFVFADAVAFAERYFPPTLGIGLCVLIALAVTAIVLRSAQWIVKRTPTDTDDKILAAVYGPLRLFLWLGIFNLGFEWLAFSQATTFVVERAMTVSLTLVALWIAFRTVAIGSEITLSRLTQGEDEQSQRGAATRISILQRTIQVALVVIGAALVLMQFSVVRSIGLSLLASASIVGVVVGIAAQKSLGNFVAGVLIAIAQPVRVGDSVVVENEFGKVEELTLTFAFIRLWDKRQLIIPVAYFLDKPFQNWTRFTPNLIGTVFVQTDFAVPVERLREELTRLCEASDHWDGQTCRLVVSDTSNQAMTLRATVSATDPDHLFDLRCEIREGLLAWLRDTDGGRFLPTLRQRTIG